MESMLPTLIWGAVGFGLVYLAVFLRIPKPATLNWSPGIAEKAAACKLPQYDVRSKLLLNLWRNMQCAADS